MTTEDKLKDLRARIDEAKQFIDKSGWDSAFVYADSLEGSEESIVWLMALAEWQAEHKV